MAGTALDAVRIVLVETQDPINIAGTIRVMKNMGISQLHLVRPCKYDPYRLEGIAHGTRDLIDAIVVHDSLDTALADCIEVAAFIGKPRAAKWPMATPREMAERLVPATSEGPVALMFGREDWGLPNEATDRATLGVTIPTTNHASLNIFQAALVGCYELHLAVGDATRAPKTPRKAAPPPSQTQYEHLYADALVALETIDFMKTRYPEHVMRTVRSLLFRAQPDARELELVRAMAIEVRRAFERAKGLPPGKAAGYRGGAVSPTVSPTVSPAVAPADTNETGGASTLDTTLERDRP